MTTHIDSSAPPTGNDLHPVAPRSIEWIAEAPLIIRATVATAADPDAIFEVLTRNEQFPEWFPGVKSVRTDGRSGLGARRIVRIPGATVAETIIVWIPGRRWAFTATAARPRFFRSLVEECVIEPGEQSTSITYTAYVDPMPALSPLVRALAPLQRWNNRRALKNLAAAAQHDGEQRRPRG